MLQDEMKTNKCDEKLSTLLRQSMFDWDMLESSWIFFLFVTGEHFECVSPRITTNARSHMRSVGSMSFDSLIGFARADRFLYCCKGMHDIAPE